MMPCFDVADLLIFVAGSIFGVLLQHIWSLIAPKLRKRRPNLTDQF